MLRPDPVPGSALHRARPMFSLLQLALAILVIAAATILGALGFEHIGGYQPCALCLMQRTPYYLGVPVAALALVAVALRAPRMLVTILFGIVALLMLYNTGLAVYHSGVEWAFWPGPTSCAPSVGVGSAADMLDQLTNTYAPSCTDAPWRMLGLSFAGWNVLVSGFLTVLAAIAARRAWRGV